MAPFIKVTFSILGPLQDLGFAASQFGEQNTKWQITIINSKAFYTKFTALLAPKIDLTSAVCTGNIYPTETSASSFSCVLEISAKVYKYNRHERDSRQSPSRSGEVSKVSRQRFAGFRLKVPFSFARSSGKPISWTRRYDTLTAREIWVFWAGTQTGKYRARNGNVPFEYVREKNSVPLPSKAKNFLQRKFQFSG